MKAKTSKSIKQVTLTDPSAVRAVALGHRATADRAPRNYSKSDVNNHVAPTDDVKARSKRYGISW